MKKEEAAEAIKWEIEANVPLSLPEIYYDWRIIEQNAGHQDHLDVLVGVLPKKTIDPYLSVLKKAGLKPFIFEIESLATARALVPGGCCQQPIMLIDLGAKKTSLAVFSGQAVYFTASLPISNEAIVATLSQKLNIDLARAKQIKFELGLDHKNPSGQVALALAPLLNDLTEKIKDYISYYQEHLPTAAGTQNNFVEKVMLCGGGANFSGLPEFLSEKLALPVSVGNPWVNIFKEASPKIAELSPGEALSFATAIGLALRGANANL